MEGSEVLRFLRTGFHFYFIGIAILTLGTALAIQSSLGTSPFDAFLVGLYRTFGLSVGTWEIVVGFTMIVCNALAERKKPEYFALITSLVTGIGIDTWLFLLGDWLIPETWIGQTICLVLGIICTALGVAAYLHSNFAPIPLDRSMLVVTNLTGLNVSYSRALISIVFVVIAYFFDGAIGIGTLLNALISGVLIGFFLPYITLIKNKFKNMEDHFVS